MRISDWSSDVCSSDLIMAGARDRTFATLGVLNAWLAEAIIALNAAPFQKRVGSRQSQLVEERAHLSPLPVTRFEAATYLSRKVARASHVDVQRQDYSVPYQHVGEIGRASFRARVCQYVEISVGRQT